MITIDREGLGKEQRVRILIAEDDQISRKVLEVSLRKLGHEVVTTCDGEEAWQAFQKPNVPQFAILDWMMPEKDGLAVCQLVREMKGGEFFYILLMSAKGMKEDIVAGLEAGADDYLIKPVDARELRVRIAAGQRVLELQQKLVEARDALHVQATHDGLTGLLNRPAIFENLQREYARSLREEKPLGVVMVDLDHFKAINDTYGHAVGDDILQEAARRMTRQCRAYDVVGRYGGEEFLILLPFTTSKEDGLAQAERVRTALAEEPFSAGGKTLTVTASLGVASTANLGPVEVEVLVKAADDALYRAKEAGRNQVVAAEKAEAEQ